LAPENDISSPLKVGCSTYDIILVPSMTTIRASTLRRLEKFQAAGGRVIFIGEIPSLVEATPSAEAKQLASKATVIPLRRRNILTTLRDHQDIEVDLQPGTSFLSDSIPAKRTLLYQMRQDEESRWLFICNTDRVTPQPNTTVKVEGDWDITLYNAMEGTHRPLHSVVSQGAGPSSRGRSQRTVACSFEQRPVKAILNSTNAHLKTQSNGRSAVMFLLQVIQSI
jgi:hypothetical protein